MSQPIRGQGSHNVFTISPKNTNLVEGVEILLPIKFCWIPFSSFREVEKCLSQSEARAAILFFPIGPKNLVEGVEILLPIKFPWIPFSGFRGEVENVSANQRPGRPSCFSFSSGALIRTEFYINTKMFKKHIASSGHCIGFDCFVDLFRLNYSLVISQLGSRRYSISETYWQDLSLLGHCSLYRIIRNCIANMYTSFNSFEFNFLLNVILQISIISLCKVVCV